MKTLFALLLISFSTQIYAIHNGKEQKKHPQQLAQL